VDCVKIFSELDDIDNISFLTFITYGNVSLFYTNLTCVHVQAKRTQKNAYCATTKPRNSVAYLYFMYYSK